ncbi:metallophosphoesterase [Photobacterium kishitanii]|uniref:Calcineurin-like phosphoesterase domain-containing protein n=1 Tax=Photobacterium kishitanii TaxID=318456 RepID=A0A2T3KML9_9GAMM|nr:metallophosphoesterase [Photobacterium kishitanii]PSV00995.1 hypothetical protein C9J27_02925 [Photobacterium kishitanii]
MISKVIGKFATFKFENNKDSRLFFCTDIHGKFRLLQESLKLLRFVNFPYSGEKTDKLICLGDIGDRGENSFSSLSAFRDNPNFFSLLGNHDLLLVNGTREPPKISKFNMFATLRSRDRSQWIDEGGAWHQNHDFSSIKLLGDWADTLPFAAQVEIGEHIIGLTHSSIVSNELFNKDNKPDFSNSNVKWSNTVSTTKEYNSITDILRKKKLINAIIFDRKPIRQDLALNVIGVDAMLHGHTLQEGTPKVLGNSISFDTGAFLMKKKSFSALTILEYAPSEDSVLGLFKIHQFKENDDGVYKI